MPSEYFSAILQNGENLFLAIVFLSVCLYFVGLYFYAQRPKQGTIEWVKLYEKERYEAFDYEPFALKDLLFWSVTFVIAWVLCALRFLIHYELGLMTKFAQGMGKMALYFTIAIFSLTTAFYSFYRLFYTSRFVAVLVTCLSCALLSTELYPVVFLLISWTFLYLWICNNSKHYRRIHGLYLLLAGVFYGLTLLTCWASFYLSPIYLAGYIVGKVLQWHRGDQERKKGRLIGSVLLLIVTGGIGIILLWLVYYGYKNENMNLLTTAFSGETYYDMIPTFVQKVIDITVPQKVDTQVVRQDLFRPILFISSLIPTVYAALWKKKSQALTAVLCAIPFLCAWIFARVDIMCPGAMLSIGWMLKGYRDRERRRYAIYICLAVLGFYYASLLAESSYVNFLL